MTRPAPDGRDRLVSRFDPDALRPRPQRARWLLAMTDGPDRTAVLDGDDLDLVDGSPRGRPDCTMRADARTWAGIARDLRGGMTAFREGRLTVRGNLHLGVGLLAATSGRSDADGALRFAEVPTSTGTFSTLEAGEGEPVVLLHGLGATKASFLSSVAALARSGHRAIAIDLPGFGESHKPLGAPYHAPWFARSVVALLDALELDDAFVVGNSMGGRVAIELGLRHPERVRGLGLLAPALAWLRDRPWASWLRLLRPELGALQPSPRPVVEAIVRRAVPGAQNGWTAAGVDEFLRVYATRRGRAAFYAAARSIYLEDGERFWSRLPGLEPPALFVWGRLDTLVPIAFQPHVREALPGARHLVLGCGHVPQMEMPGPTHTALARFFAEAGQRAAA